MPSPSLKLEPPLGAQKVLLHSCCAPCSCAIVEALLRASITPVIFYFNPNIYPLDEYQKRKAECRRFAAANNLEQIDGDYDHAEWLRQVKGFEAAPERGARCQICFNLRLLKTAQTAKERGIGVFCTTLASSRWKDLEQINAAGALAQRQVEGALFWAQNWRKGGLQQRRGELIKEYSFYNQQYCGCEFSTRATPQEHRRAK